MLAKRIIPCLDIREGQTVKGINFAELKNVGDPVELGAKYAAEEADELVYLDISATEEGRGTFTGLVSRIAARIDIPFTVGGGIASVADAGRLLDAGADKVTVNSAAVRDPGLIDAIASKYGSQFVVAAIDAKRSTAYGASRPTAASGSPSANSSHGRTKYGGAARARFSSRRWTTTAPATATPAKRSHGWPSCPFRSSLRAGQARCGISPTC